MYRAMSIEEVTKPSDTYSQSVTPGLRVMLWRVELNAAGRPVWVTHRQGSTWWIYRGFGYQHEEGRCRKAARASQPKAIPTISSAAHNKLVTMAEAAKLVDVVPPGSLDRLTEMLQDAYDPNVLQNYVKPPKVKAPGATDRRRDGSNEAGVSEEKGRGVGAEGGSRERQSEGMGA